MKIKSLFVVVLLFVSIALQSQNRIDSITLKSDKKIFANLYHQHHDFFDKAFSLQGLEVGLILKQKLQFGLYGSCFVTNLKTEINNKSKFIWLGQGGFNIGYLYKAKKKIHAVIQLNSGAFSLRTDENNFGLFQTKQAEFKLNGLVLSPQIFGELNVTNWFNIRTGLSYNLYTFKDSAIIQPTDLNHVSFTFGMVFIFNK